MDRISSKAASMSISCFESIALFSNTFIASPISSASRFLFSLSATSSSSRQGSKLRLAPDSTV
uniref:Uncharacterized protein n=1 Tax=Arundo donax TaxID=35708 RepID=A0A0A9EBA0_ARUDO